MENPSWLLVLSSGIAVVGMGIIFRQLLSRFQEQGEAFDLQKELQSFLTKIVMIEAIPIVLIAWAIMQLFEGAEFDFLIPLFILIGLLLFGFIQVFLVRQQVVHDPRLPEKVKRQATGLSSLGYAFITAIPIISIAIILAVYFDLLS